MIDAHKPRACRTSWGQPTAHTSFLGRTAIAGPPDSGAGPECGSSAFPARAAWLGGLLLVATLAATCGWALAAEAPQPATRPNVLVVLTDDQGWGDLSIHGNQNLSTPRIDSLAHDGALCEQFLVCPVCSPTRAEYLTGRYHPRGGVFSTSTGGERLDLDETTIAQVFHQAGYRTGIFGKWHNGMQYPYHPLGRGFQEFYGFCSGHWGDYFDAPLEHNGQLVQGRGYIADDLTDHAIEFIGQQSSQPFFCYVPYNTPHSPMQVPDRFYEKFRDAPLSLRATQPEAESLPMTRAALAMCENLDWNVGRLLDSLQQRGLAERTIVVYFCDNGPNSYRWLNGMKGRKGSTDDGGVRSPCLIRFPGRIAPGTRVAPICGAIDLLPTLADLAGVSFAPPKPLDGKSIKPLLISPAGAAGREANTPGAAQPAAAVDWPDRMIFSHWSGKVSVRTDRYRLDAAGALFDLASDPGQRRDISSQQPEQAAQLRTAVAQWKQTVLAELTQAERPFAVGYRQLPLTQLPARDGIPHGQVQRSAKAPNCSYFTGWKSVDDRISWNVDVATAGRYEATLYYTCPAADVGSTVELSLGPQRVTGQVTQGHDPPLVGAEHDRVPRDSESLVKDFRPLVLGQIELPAGRGQLSLRATQVPGRQVMDLRAVTLRLLP